MTDANLVSMIHAAMEGDTVAAKELNDIFEDNKLTRLVFPSISLQLKLWKFSLPDVEDVLYLYSLRNDEKFLRQQFRSQDQGDMDYDIYQRLYTQGKIERITDLSEVADGEKTYFPYTSWELDPSETFSIEDFLAPSALYR